MGLDMGLANQTTHFLLVPDRSAARHVRRLVAEQSPRLGVRVGTWGELLEALRAASLTAPPDDRFMESLAEAAHTVSGFWRHSLEVAPSETLAILDRELTWLLDGLRPGQSLAGDGAKGLSALGETHLRGLSALHAAMGGCLPPSQALAHTLLNMPSGEQTSGFIVYHEPGLPHLAPISAALLAHLAANRREEPDATLAGILKLGLRWEPQPGTPPALGILQTGLFNADHGGKVPPDASVQVVAVRDPLEEVEVCAGMIQQALAGDATLRPGEIGLMLPADAEYGAFLRDVFRHCGLPLSGLEVVGTATDAGAEVVRLFLLACRKPSPYMVLSALLAHPLMPWDAETGHDLAVGVNSNRFKLKDWEDLPAVQSALLKEVYRGTSTPKDLKRGLDALEAALAGSEGAGAQSGEAYRERAAAVLSQVRGVLGPQQRLDWNPLLEAAALRPGPAIAREDITREGIAVFADGQEPWRPVRHLFVLGFAEGRYPREGRMSALFNSADQTVLQANGYALRSAGDIREEQRARLLRQFCAAGESLTMLLPRKDLLGAPVHPSSTLVFMAPLFQGVEGADDLLLELDRAGHPERVRWLAKAAKGLPVSPRALPIADIDLKRNLLLEIKQHESPSSLDTLMTSPLGWLLDRVGLTPRTWAPEELDVMTQGTLAHHVFEHLFMSGAPIPNGAEIESRVETMLHAAIQAEAPFMATPEWRVERENLRGEITLAAIQWSTFLLGAGAEILEEEAWLNGTLEISNSLRVELRGRSDLLLRLPTGRVIVVDYKKASATKRRKQMGASHDLQANLYRIMLQTGDYSRAPSLAAALEGGPEIGVMYYLMNSRHALSDTEGWLPPGLGGVTEMGQDVFHVAMELLSHRLRAVHKGRVALNQAGDDKRWDGVGVGFYAPGNHPLVALFQHPEPAQKEDAS